VRQRLDTARAAVEAVCRSVVFRDPSSRLRTQVQRLDELGSRLRSGVREQVAAGRRRLEPGANRLAALPPARLRERAAAAVDRLAGRLAWALGGRSKRAGDALAALLGRMMSADPKHRLQLARQEVSAAERQLEAMSYRSVLSRGYSVTRSAGGRIVRSVAEAAAGEVVETELTDGRFRSRVDGGAAAPRAAPGPGAAGPAKPRNRPAGDGPTLFD
jgi:exonuclease VII large subunit